jgi:hypothetical protein
MGDLRHLRRMHKRAAPLQYRERRRRHGRAGLPSVHLYPSDRVKPVATRLPRLVARGYTGCRARTLRP